ncbi:tRNA N(3)-methylcytidine methyltransferase METTL2A isoform X1 [Mauremys reevesii]|uniref:tRNA N(3)-methylcytidine methyltransferase METTL2A isoform X1 n=1 Tax=Mauremys reevesii TaxID=260615 RepID=UPI00193F1C29|nr:tRNA N(3)-methylcytidine methyltransferase METTL2A isoform X1 [Mauremys reevesii]
MAAPGGPEVAAAAAAPGRRQPFGSRFLTDPSRLFQHNAWDNVEWSEEQEASARNKVQENSRQLVPQDKQDEYELNANEYWNDFYKIHENGFFKDRHWLFTEFPELAPNQNLSQPEASEYKDGSTRKPRDTRLGSCENGLCSLETRTQEHHHLDLMKDSNNIINRLDTDGEAVLKLGDLKLSDGDFPGSSATYRILEVGCGAGNTVFPILQTNNDPGLFVYCCDFSNTAVDLVQTNAEYDSSRCFAFVHDLCKDQSPYPMPEESLDIIILIFVLSALLPEKMQYVINRLSRLLKPGGMILLRDYGRYDLAQLRFKKGRCLSDNFYVRGDGTRVYFFTQDELDALFTTAGLEKVQNLVDRRLQVNRGKQVTMHRVWIQCKYRKPFPAGQKENGHVH